MGINAETGKDVYKRKQYRKLAVKEKVKTSALYPVLEVMIWKKIKRLPDAEFEIMKVVWTNEPPVTTTNLMVIRDESGQITSVANLIEEQAQKYDAQERPDMLYLAIAASFTPYSRSVSYTHLDVYKRQVLPSPQEEDVQKSDMTLPHRYV